MFDLPNAAHRNNRPLLVFIHGFLGSAESFNYFPRDLRTSLLDHDLEVDTITYTYDTRGDNLLAVQQLVTFLKRNAPSDKRSCVILIAHSMGGILAVDAARELLAGVVEGVGQRQPTSIADAVEAEAERQTAEPSKPHLSTQSTGFPDCTIIGIIAFDSPYFGVHENVFTSTASTRVVEAAESLQSWAEWLGWSQTQSTTATIAGASAAAGATASVAAASLSQQQPQEEEQQRGRALEAKPPSSLVRSQSPFSPSAFWKWGAVGLAAAVTGGIAYATSQQVAQKVDQVAQDARSHMQFLGPLWTDLSQMKRRMTDVRRLEPMMVFKGYYCKIPPLIQESPSSAASPPRHRTFILPPPSSITDLFTPHPMPKARDEIEAHTNMFDKIFDEEAYKILRKETARIVAEIMKEKGTTWL
ncbi:hypothetical protein HK097_001295 [Rhizophlyctis rosea]|uniref:AB hydrolase-1 domain-containing protein n=1 Tax=Rhizophlyctis rosea TaxID=64517 RepID=A0AAD5X218_9FUNG|nr:hypothetical protein HK097_001295 [Rhizophlyctis rosea]